jgi:hypothetical protein
MHLRFRTHLLDIENKEVQAEERLERLHALLELELPSIAQPFLRHAFRELLQPPLTLLNRALPARRLAHTLKHLRLDVDLEDLAPRIKVALYSHHISVSSILAEY